MKKDEIDKDWFSEELNHYNKKYIEKTKEWKYDRLFLKAHKDFFNMINEVIKKNKSCTVLDLGCGDGSRTRYLSLNPNVSLIGIDISESGIEKANSNKIGKATYYKMKVEELDFKPNFFDLIIDYGSFSSFKMKIVWPLINKLLKPEGSIIGIETLGDNPLFKIKRTLNIKRKKRTSNLYGNIISLNQLFIWSKKCSRFNYKTYGFFSLFLTPLILIFNNSLINYFIKLADKLDEIIFMRFQFFQRNSFKVLFHYKFSNDLK